MDINFTFFVQIFHFFIAYYILEKLFCRPTIKALEKEKTVYTDLLASITTQQNLLTQKEQDKHNEWQRIKLFFSQALPLLGQKKEEPLAVKTPSIPTISAHEQQKLRHNIYKILKQRLSHVE